MKTPIFFLQLFAALALAPLVSGIIAKVKNNLRTRKGQSVLQPYFNLAKQWGKDEVVSATASWIFRVAPLAFFSSSLAGLLLVLPAFSGTNAPGDCLALIFVLALGRFFMALAALDTGSFFGGMGSSREMFIAGLAEPTVCVAFFAVALQSGSTQFGQMGQAFSLSRLGACLALFMVSLAETSRIPIDNQETHLELTMIHEAMVLEYSGRSLALIEYSSSVKQLVWFSLIAYLAFPSGSFAFLAAKIVGLAVLVAAIEVSVAKMRLFRAVDYFGFSFVAALLAAAGAIFGI